MTPARNRRSIKVAVIGAGLGGVACAVQLERAGFSDVTVFERADGPGGVWWNNTYPGCEVDVDSQVYSYSFLRWDWSRTHASQPEVQRYVEAVIDHFAIRERFRFGVGVTAVRWNDESSQYMLESSQGPAGPYDVVVSAVGMLSNPSIPDWPGLDSFKGPVFHTSEYRHDIDLTGRRVALVGTGSTACQLGPQLAERVSHLDLYQREPGYVLPKKARNFLAAERSRYRKFPILQRLTRWKLLYDGNRAYRAFDTSHPQQLRTREFHRSYLERKVTDPETRHALIPKYPYGCKRPVFTSDFYPMFNTANVCLIPQAVSRLTAVGVVSADGTERPSTLATMLTLLRWSSAFESGSALGSETSAGWSVTPLRWKTGTYVPLGKSI